MRRFCTALALTVLMAATAIAQSVTAVVGKPFRLKPLALTGQPAPGVPGGTFQFFGAIPATGQQTSGSPAIDGDGNLAFAAGVDVPSGNGTIHLLGLWKQIGGPVELLALQGDPAPGTVQTFQAFPSIYFGLNPSLVHGRYAFQAALNASGNQPMFGSWTNRFGPLSLVLLENSTLPGLPPTGSVMQPLSELVPNGQIVLTAAYSDFDDGGYIDAEQEGFWRADGQSFTLVIRDDAQAPGCPAGVVFGEANSFAQGSFDHLDVNGSARIAFNGWVKGPGVALLSDEGVWYEGAGGLTLLAREGNTAPGAGNGAVFGSGAGLHSFGSAYNVPVEINDNGSVLFGAGLRGPNFDYGESVWVRRSGQLQLVVKAFGASYSFNADPAPGFAPGTTFTNVYAAHLNALDQVAVNGFAGGVQGLWWEHGAGLELLARAGGAVPGVPGATFINNFGLNLGEFTDSGTLYYEGTFSGPGIVYGNNGALFAVEPSGVTHIVVRKGQRIRLAADDVRVVSNFGAGESSDAGEKTLKLVFGDGSSGLFTASLQ